MSAVRRYCLLSLIVWTTPLYASAPVVYSDSASINLLASDAPTLSFQGSSGTSTQLHFDKSKQVTIRAPASNAVRIVMVDANALLFTYTAKEITKTQTDNAKAAATFGDALSKALDTLKGGNSAPVGGAALAVDGGRAPAEACRTPPKGARLQAVKLNGIDVQALAGDIGQVNSLWQGLPNLIDETLDHNTLTQAKADAQKQSADLRRGDPTKSLVAVEDLWRQLLLGHEVTWAVEYANPQWNDTGVAKDARGLAIALRSCVGNFDQLLDNLNIVAVETPKIQAQIADIQAVTTAVGGIGDTRVTTVDFDAANNQSQPIQVDANARFMPLLSTRAKDLQKTLVGTYTVVVAPYDRIHMRPSVGVIYSFVKSPSFSTAYDSTGALKINASNTSSPSEYAGMVAVEFIRDQDFGSGIEPFGQLGVASAGKNLGFLTGLGIRAYKAFTFSLGVVYQRVDKLSSGLSVGDTIKQASDLKTDKEWKPGLYIGIGVKLN